ncbi:hypothetical protein BDW02DRAFT_132800 [Decorospora gaudefroyi]|uniref:Uncharacterized protein n=1 Tax=Decorospora gaudefroyi TaxID=184978 RepID=A0A6A5JY15_9PLEO|nr:hypothetical protein BDW02DRAFT_132800 [Decorospora gaudefroyi]
MRLRYSARRRTSVPVSGQHSRFPRGMKFGDSCSFSYTVQIFVLIAEDLRPRFDHDTTVSTHPLATKLPSAAWQKNGRNTVDHDVTEPLIGPKLCDRDSAITGTMSWAVCRRGYCVKGARKIPETPT